LFLTALFTDDEAVRSAAAACFSLLDEIRARWIGLCFQFPVWTLSLPTGFGARCVSGVAAEGADCAPGGDTGSGGGSGARAIGWSSARTEKLETNNNARESATNRRALLFIERGSQKLMGIVLPWSTGQSLVAVGHPDDALAGFALLTVFEGGQSGGFAISARGSADVFSCLRCRQ